MAGSILSAFGSDKVTPRYLTKGLNKPLTELGKRALDSLQTGGQAALEPLDVPAPTLPIITNASLREQFMSPGALEIKRRTPTFT